ncbi:PstS family phosphate ABC transporter substrate-binding protein [Mucilaginibacter ginsenosidivorax]|uniref:Phosphate ABC transporter substrate-binding protein n=1 Tax=Mucilaginibacter ginsenosidivorax TaxID=862126 RepID=A0A5B8VY84_9SPHI|nr:substrate-binding domain-containing protein [Mucilaginibacter ginsenosidivorax]QEC76211.1 phosphate ABC transporter substrate-binding protein [Mucilaginibacter ginsenosidivorax]
MMNSYTTKCAFFLLLAALSLQACNSNPAATKGTDTFDSGKALFAADESFAPIIEQEEYVFKSRHADANPTFLYRSENQAINMLLNDSVRMAVLARNLDTVERNVLIKRGLSVEVQRFAIDAVALIVNHASNDTTITVSTLKKMLNGQGDLNKTIVFDNPNSSLVRYLKEFSGNKEFKQKNIYALKSNKEVIKYVSEHPDALGITGFSWLNDPAKDIAAYVDNVKIVSVKDEANKEYPGQYFKPSQESLVLKQYPLSRGLYLVNSSSKIGLAIGFATFLGSDVGQRIILRSGLLPDSIPPREIILKSK